ncbi:maleylpyruvate isomerase N-terminal domain-containing protein [Streptomyces sp. TRM76323]|uniref:Maleylpyruvate isomerase N-terminal domain-containing protein n=1 Tax=Streptomyces tamarix TaxID=3078565 RepID=A0ABU3QNM2_9ACTN|nr:maleylpyruvate isomerase N-terminal domain-containing protein [Streptomyces tamarix]MDT9684361.1 maleylpyruvate isomerase N-terminal domain-containing protein [Streptomyces tamarix]
MTEALERALADALAHLLTAAGTRGDGASDPDGAVRWTEHTARVLQRLEPADRRRLSGLFHDTARREPEGARRAALLRLPESLGLTGGAHAAYCDGVQDHMARFVAAVRGADPATPVPTCPGWTLADLARHVGEVHRWMEHLVRTRAPARVEVEDVPLDLPGDPAAYPAWLARGTDAVLRALRAAHPDTPMWSYGADPHVRFYPRRLFFETAVHLADVELALGAEPLIAPGTAADGIEEFLENLPYYGWVAEPTSRLGRDGATLRLRAADTGGVWTLTLGGGGFAWRADGDDPTGTGATVTVEAGCGELLLLLYGRYGAGERRFTVTGDRALLDAWLAATRF